MTKFHPKKNQEYFMINSRFKVMAAIHNGSNKSNGRIEGGNAFRTRKDAMRFLNGMLGLVKVVNRRWWEFWV